jgi:hypothetical protein
MPADFYMMYEADAWIPAVRGGPQTGPRRWHNWILVGRLDQGVGMEEARAEVDVISAQLADAYPESNEGMALRLDPLQDGLAEGYRLTLSILLSVVFLVLLLACGNVASLLVARG